MVQCLDIPRVIWKKSMMKSLSFRSLVVLLMSQSEYSSGMKSKLGFSIATIANPDILILDEVLSVGDARFKKKSEAKIMQLMEGGTTVLFVSHSLETGTTDL